MCTGGWKTIVEEEEEDVVPEPQEGGEEGWVIIVVVWGSIYIRAWWKRTVESVESTITSVVSLAAAFDHYSMYE